jgi:carboxyl-terminal processing protease
MPALSRRSLRTLACALPVLLAACGGGGDGDGGSLPPLSCSVIGGGGNSSTPPPLDGSVSGLQNWLRGYMNDWYFWYRLAPNPSPAGYGTVDAYFQALLYPGGDLIPNGGGAVWPSDRYSGYESTESFNRFFGAGQTLGYGVAVNGLEAVDQGETRLFIRYIEPASPAALSGRLARGDEVLAINGIPATTLIDQIANDTFTVLSPEQRGDAAQIDLRRNGTTERVTLNAEIFALTPVQNAQVLFTPNGRSIGYVMVKDMIDQARSPLDTAFASFRAQGVQDVVLDLRYNGGGLVSMACALASYTAGSRANGQTFAGLRYNDRKQSNNQDFLFTSNPAQWSGVGRVFVLTGQRTCSASEQVINGLRGVGVNVVAIGDTTCGKPVGFLPQSDSFGTTYSVVNFESVNARNEGRYFSGFAPTPNCAVAEDLNRPIADLSDPLLVAAAHHIDTGNCPVVAGAREAPQSRSVSPRARYNGADGGERTGMSAR